MYQDCAGSQKLEEVMLEDGTKWMEIGERSFGKLLSRVPNSPTGQVLEAGPGWLVLVMAMTGLD